MEGEIKKQPEKEKESGVTIVISLTRPRRPIGSYMVSHQTGNQVDQLLQEVSKQQ